MFILNLLLIILIICYSKLYYVFNVFLKVPFLKIVSLLVAVFSSIIHKVASLAVLL